MRSSVIRKWLGVIMLVLVINVTACSPLLERLEPELWTTPTEETLESGTWPEPQATAQPVLAETTASGGSVAEGATALVDRGLLAQEELLANLYDAVNPSVVNVNITTRSGEGAGSGFVYNQQGHIVTNNHVVEDATTLTVTLSGSPSLPISCSATCFRIRSAVSTPSSGPVSGRMSTNSSPP